MIGMDWGENGDESDVMFVWWYGFCYLLMVGGLEVIIKVIFCDL